MVGFDRIIGLCRPGERGGEESVQTWKGGGGGEVEVNFPNPLCIKNS